MSKEKTFWLSFDLGLKGDYPALFTWLDKHNAKECGDGLAVFNYVTNTNKPHNEVREDLKKSLTLAGTDRLYLIWFDDTKMRNLGVFIAGRRKTAAWEGYYTKDTEITFDNG